MGLPITLRGRHALILHPEGQSRRSLVMSLQALDMNVVTAWPEIEDYQQPLDVIFFDVDRGHDAHFPWKKGDSPVPMIALIGSEAPGRIEWAISHKAAAYLLKPIGSSGVFSALTIAFQQFEVQKADASRIKVLEDRLKARPMVLKVVLDEMQSNGIDDDEAFRRLRSSSMELQLSVEEYCAHRLAQSSRISEKVNSSKT